MRQLIEDIKNKVSTFLGGKSLKLETETLIQESQLQQDRRELVRNIYSYYSTNLPMKKGMTQFINPRSGVFVSEDIYELTIKVKPYNQDISVDISKFQKEVEHLDSEVVEFEFVPNECKLISMTHEGMYICLPERLRVYKRETEEID